MPAGKFLWPLLGGADPDLDLVELSLLASVYECSVPERLGLDDSEQLPAADRLINKTTAELERRLRPVQGAGLSGSGCTG